MNTPQLAHFQSSVEKRTRPKIAYLTSNDPFDRRSWSGTHYYMAQALHRHCGDLVPIGPITPGSVMIRKVIKKSLRLLTGKTYLYTHTVSLAKQLAEIAEKRITEQAFDLVFAPAASAHIAFLQTKLPIVYLSDATFAGILNYYPEFSSVLNRCIRDANTLEQLAIDRASLIMYSSSWAAESASNDYHADRAKVHVLPFGANLEEAPSAETVLTRPRSNTCRLLFVGVDWKKKGADIAVETMEGLEQLGVPAELTIVGCAPPTAFHRKNVKIIKFLNKNDPRDRRELDKLYLCADFFLLPTRADCSPIVLSEASAFGLPSITTNTGGISDTISSGENGYLLPLSASGWEYAQLIAELYTDRKRHTELRNSSRAAFDTRLNWDAWGREAARLIDDLLSRRKTSG